MSKPDSCLVEASTASPSPAAEHSVLLPLPRNTPQTPLPLLARLVDHRLGAKGKGPRHETRLQRILRRAKRPG